MTKTVAIIGTLDTKGREFDFLRAEIERRGFRTIMIDVGVLRPPATGPTIDRERVAAAAGESICELVASGDRGKAIDVMARGAARIVDRLYHQGEIDGAISMGGSGGTLIGTTAMLNLPSGIPKIIVTTGSIQDMAHYINRADILAIPSIVDIAGLNRITRPLISRAAAVMCAMLGVQVGAGEGQPAIAATMTGNTTLAVEFARGIFEENGYEVLIFHANGGGRNLEALVGSGEFSGVFDISTTELANELCGGVRSAGPDRLEAAAKMGVPQVVAPGGIDMCNFWAESPLPEHYQGRRVHLWSPRVLLLRTNPDENLRLGELFARKLNDARGPVKILLPLKGFSELDKEGEPFWWPEADQAFREALKSSLRRDIPVLELDHHINDSAFAQAAAQTLLDMVVE